MKKRDRRQTPNSTSLAAGWPEAVPESTELKADTASAFYLDGKGTSRDSEELKDITRVIPKEMSKINKSRKDKRNNFRVPILNPDGTSAMPTTSRRANKWLKEKKAKIVKNKLGIFQIQLLFEPSGKNKQPIVMTIDPGSAFTGIGVISKKSVLYGVTLELPGYKKGAKPNIVVNRFGKKIEKYPNVIIEGMDKRRQLRRSRRHRNCRRRHARWLNRSKTKIAPSILARKQLELKVVAGLSKIYPISILGYEDIKFNHFKDKEGIKGQFFSHVEVGKNWLLDRLKKIIPKGNIRIIRGYETNIRREQLRLKKEKDKTVRNPESHVNDCIAMGSLILGLGIETKNKFKFDTITRPKYSRRILHLEQFSKGGIRRRYGGTTTDWTKIRKGDFVEAIQGKKAFRGWVSGFVDDKRIISVSNFDWKRIVQFGESNIRLLDRNHGLLLRSLYMEKERIDMCKYGTVQVGIGNAW